MTRLAYVCADPGVPVFGRKGASIHVQEVIRALRRAGAEVHLYAARLGGVAPVDLADLHVTTTPAPAAASEASPETRARAALRNNRATHDRLVADGPFDFVYERYSLWSLAGVAYGSGLGHCPSLVEVNAPLIDEQASWRELPLPQHATRIARYLSGHATSLLAVSPAVATWLAGHGAAPERIEVIANGVDASRFDGTVAARRARHAGPARGPLTIGFVGTLKPWHGVPTLIEAWSHLLQRGIAARLLLVGDGPQAGAIEADIRARGLGDLATLAGSVAPAAIPALLSQMDIAVAPYPADNDFYFSPLKLYEYLAAGLPVACSRVGHLDQIIRDGVDGLLHEPGNAGDLADNLARLAAEPALRERLGLAGQARVRAHHSWDGVAQRILARAGLGQPSVGQP